MTYTHLPQEERYQIHSLKRQGIHLPQIAAELGRSPSTISREMRRNATAQGYKPALAQCEVQARQGQRRNARQFDACQWALVELYLRLHLSPQEVSVRLRLEKRLSIGTESIYQHTYVDKAHDGDAQIRATQEGGDIGPQRALAQDADVFGRCAPGLAFPQQRQHKVARL